MTCKELEIKFKVFFEKSLSIYNATSEQEQQLMRDRIEFLRILNNLYEKSIEENYYWIFCSFKTYKETFKNRFNIYQSKFIDAELIDFIDYELLRNTPYESETKLRERKKHENDLYKILRNDGRVKFEFIYDSKDLKHPIFNYNDILEKLSQAHNKKIKYLTDMRQSLLNNDWSIKETQPIQTIKSNIKFKGTQTEFIELVKALIENNSIEGNSQKDIINKLSQFLNIDIKSQSQTISDLKDRQVGNETLFLDKLKSSLLDYISK